MHTCIKESMAAWCGGHMPVVVMPMSMAVAGGGISLYLHLWGPLAPMVPTPMLSSKAVYVEYTLYEVWVILLAKDHFKFKKSIGMLKGVGTEVPKCVETRKHPCSITWDGTCNNNNLCNPIKQRVYGVMWFCLLVMHYIMIIHHHVLALQVQFLQVIWSYLISEDSICLQATLSGTTVYEHCTTYIPG